MFIITSVYLKPNDDIVEFAPVKVAPGLEQLL
jgi:hypothetical protein